MSECSVLYMILFGGKPDACEERKSIVAEVDEECAEKVRG